MGEKHQFSDCKNKKKNKKLTSLSVLFFALYNIYYKYTCRVNGSNCGDRQKSLTQDHQNV